MFSLIQTEALYFIAVMPVLEHLSLVPLSAHPFISLKVLWVKFQRKNNHVAQGGFEPRINSKNTELSSLYMVTVWDW